MMGDYNLQIHNPAVAIVAIQTMRRLAGVPCFFT